MDISLQRVTPPQEERQAGPSGGIPEEGIAISDRTAARVLFPSKPPGGTRHEGGSQWC